MSPQAAQMPFLAGQRAKRPFVNRFTKYFFTELDKGLASPWILLSSGAMLSYLAWRVTERYVAPRREMLAMRPPIQKVPLSASHNAFWGIKSVSPDRMEPGPGEGLEAVTVAEASAAAGSSQLYTVQADDVAHEHAMRRPQVVHSEPSELRERPTLDNPTGEVDIVCLELPEYDPGLRDDVYYRSVHYVPNSTTSSPPSASAGEVKGRGGQEKAPRTGGPEDGYLAFMPGKGEDFIHGMAKCKAVTALNNCVPYAGHLESEVARKLMLALAPVHVLRDTGKSFLTTRFTFVKQTPVESLVIGLHGGEMPRWLSRSFPNFNVDVIEADGALVSVVRRFLGFQESSNLQLRVGNPIDYLRRVAAEATLGNKVNKAAKRYDLVLIDAVDGAGHLSTQYSRLENVTNLRNAMSDNGCVAMTIPNGDASLLYNVVQNWRMAFQGRTALLIHCYTSPTTILMTFQDHAERGKANMGTVASVEEFQDLLRAHLRHYGSNRVQFDLTREVSEDNFTVLHPGRVYEMADYLPRGHPELARMAERRRGGAPTQSSGWNAWLRRVMGAYLSPAQRADLGYRSGSPTLSSRE